MEVLRRKPPVNLLSTSTRERSPRRFNLAVDSSYGASRLLRREGSKTRLSRLACVAAGALLQLLQQARYCSCCSKRASLAAASDCQSERVLWQQASGAGGSKQCVCVCVCVCVCLVAASERRWWQQAVCVCVCVCVCLVAASERRLWQQAVCVCVCVCEGSEACHA
jgi:hypothetical protein